MLSTQEVTFYNEELYFGLGNTNEQTITMLNNQTALSSTSSMVMSEQLRSPPPSRFGSALGASVAFIFIVFGMLGDTLIIAAILSKRELRNNMVNIFIVSLQLNDLFNIGFNQFLVGLGYLFMKWHVPYIVCEMVVYTSIICTGTLLWHHALIAIHRYLVVVCNLNINHFKRAPKFYALFSVIIARLIPTLVCAPALYSRHMTVYSPAALRCMLAPGVSGLQNLLIVLLLILAPCIVVLFCFANIFARVRTVSKNVKLGSGYVSVSSGGGGSGGGLTVGGGVSAKSSVSVNGGGLKPLTTQLAQEIIMSHSAAAAANKQSSVTIVDKANKIRHNSPSNYTSAFSMSLSSMHREIQISKMFAIIFTVFLFGYLPYGIIRLIDSKNSLNPDVYVMLTVLFIISISISPIIYGLMNKQIKMQCKLLLTRLFRCCCFCRNGEVADEKATFMTKSRHGQNKPPINHFAIQRSPPQTTRHQAVSPKISDHESSSSSEKDNNNNVEQKDRTCEKNGSPTKAQNPLISSSLPQLNAAANEASSNPYCPKECHSLMNTTNVVKEEKSGRRVRSSMSKHFFSLFTKSSSLKKQPPTVNSSGDVEKTSLPTSPHENKTQPDEVGESLTQSKLLILAEDDGGVYKGPTID